MTTQQPSDCQGAKGRFDGCVIKCKPIENEVTHFVAMGFSFALFMENKRIRRGKC